MKRSAFFKDRIFLLLMAFGPVFWLSYYIYEPHPISWLVPASAPWRLVMLVLVYPLLEEIVFRGLLLELAAKWFSQRWQMLSLANVMTSLVFSAAHLIHQTMFWSALVFFPSLLFGLARERSGGLWAPILLHVWYNLGFIWLFRAM